MFKRNMYFVLFILFLVLLPSIIFSFSWIISKYWWNFVLSHNIDKELKIFFSGDLLLNKKIGDYYYKLWEYDKALFQYEKIKCNDDKKYFFLYHNAWNTFYYIWKTIDNKIIKLDYYQKSINTYLKALTIKKDEETLANYEFVMGEIDKLLEEEKQNQAWKWDENKKKENKWEWQKEDTEVQIWEKTPTYKLNETTEYELSQDEIDKLKQYLEQLKQEEKENMFLNKPKEEESIESILRWIKNFGNEEVESDW